MKHSAHSSCMRPVPLSFIFSFAFFFPRRSPFCPKNECNCNVLRSCNWFGGLQVAPPTAALHVSLYTDGDRDSTGGTFGVRVALEFQDTTPPHHRIRNQHHPETFKALLLQRLDVSHTPPYQQHSLHLSPLHPNCSTPSN